MTLIFPQFVIDYLGKRLMSFTIVIIQEKSKPLLLSRGSRNEDDVFFPAAEN
mgnify:CR=1 FL=1